MQLAFLPYLAVYRIIVTWLFHMELSRSLNIGESLRVFHGICLVIHPRTRIGNYVTLPHCVTLRNKGGASKAPVLEDYVEVGAYAAILGPVTIGQHGVVGAGAVVAKVVPPGAVVVGNPVKIIWQRTLTSREGDAS